MEKEYFTRYIDILNEELIPALGCTEPIAVAFAAAVARQTLGEIPRHMKVHCSGNIIKNVKGVVVPNSGNMRGIEIAALLGAVGGDAEKGLEVLAEINEQHRIQARNLLEKNICEVKTLDTVEKLHIRIFTTAGDHSSLVEIKHSHLNIVRIEKDGKALFSADAIREGTDRLTDRSCLNIADIVCFANNVSLPLVENIINMQIRFNTEISNEGLNNCYGANVGKTLLECYGNDVCTRAKATASAGSDARMSGCTLPVVINSGSGNQGLTVSLPVIVYAKELKVPQEKLIRALLVSNLTAIHQKTRIGRLSAYCGAVSAACGSGAGIAFLFDASQQEIEQTIVNTLANTSGIVCDGAKPSCAAKIATSVDAAIMAFHLASKGRTFRCGEGLVKNTVEETISSIGKLAQDGMRQTDKEILNIMMED